MSGAWQPMETAPLDTLILLSVGRLVVTGRWVAGQWYARDIGVCVPDAWRLLPEPYSKRTTQEAEP